MAREPTHGWRAIHPEQWGTADPQQWGSSRTILTSNVTPTRYLHRHPYARSAARDLITTSVSEDCKLYLSSKPITLSCLSVLSTVLHCDNQYSTDAGFQNFRCQ